ncbi:hypothetical protein [Flavihumibacter sp. CACIAM 22H1]|uniref:hypothetical protein n=1 Tax=Flavihumibacter sp. CACIAM 22H1 TaxID=1812911 RepID=UPI0007A7C9CE|nr:hypothetical protein [Flavihumibacter sp. CACIAM 22H1]KYP14509.1 MAG: hypothetical protein A1D16_15400 [Flavihumibacter sp. CACIAM 22H1]
MEARFLSVAGGYQRLECLPLSMSFSGYITGPLLRNRLFFMVLLVSCSGAGTSVQQPDLIKGVYGNPAALWEAGYDFPGLGINAVFVRAISLSPEFVKLARAEQVKVFVEFPVLNGKTYLQAHPEAWPITASGERAEPADWFMGICPTDTAFKNHRVRELSGILTDYSVDGIFLDYFHWHAQFETPAPILPETCFCNRCIGLFEQYGALRVPGSSTSDRAAWILAEQDSLWRKWRSAVLLDWATTLKQVIQADSDSLMMGIFHCGWLPHEHKGALYKNLGIDLPALATVADVLSPMLFHQMKNRPVSWVADYMAWLGQQPWAGGISAPKFWPIVQGNDQPSKLSAASFDTVLRAALKYPSSGVMPFSAESIAGDSAKLSVLRKLYIANR